MLLLLILENFIFTSSIYNDNSHSARISILKNWTLLELKKCTAIYTTFCLLNHS